MDYLNLATHAQVFFILGAASNLTYALAYFFTKDVSSYQIRPVSIFELEYNLRVCAFGSDEASPNRLFYQLYCILIWSNLMGKWYTVHPIFLLLAEKSIFFSDAPHWVKTTRNCFFKSGSVKPTRVEQRKAFTVGTHCQELLHGSWLGPTSAS